MTEAYHKLDSRFKNQVAFISVHNFEWGSAHVPLWTSLYLFSFETHTYIFIK